MEEMQAKMQTLLANAEYAENLPPEGKARVETLRTLNAKHEEIDTAKTEHHEVAKKRKSDGKRLKDALTVAKETKEHPFMLTPEYITFDERRDFAQRGRSRVAPPQDHAAAKGGANVRGAGRRASVAQAVALDQALKEAKDAEAAFMEGGQSHSGDALVAALDA